MLPEWSDPDRRDAALIRVAQRLQQADPLTQRQLAVVFLLSHGVTYPQQAPMLHLSLSSLVEAHKQAKERLGTGTQAHTVATALRLGLIS